MVKRAFRYERLWCKSCKYYVGRNRWMPHLRSKVHLTFLRITSVEPADLVGVEDQSP